MAIVPIPSKEVESVVKEAKGLFNKFLGPFFEEAGELLGDHMRLVRLNRQIDLLRKAEQLLAEKGLQPKAVKMNVLLPLLETAMLEDDKEMSDRWASLLATAAGPNAEPFPEATFIEILKQLSPVHAFILTVFYEQIEQRAIPSENWDEKGIVESYFQEMLKPDDKRKLSSSEFNVAINNLRRLGLINYPSIALGRVNGNELRVQATTANILCATHLGSVFVAACSKIPREGTRYGVPTDSISNVYATDVWPTLPITERLQ
jgi:hypothetical protein